ncbi:uncharacterized protein H6S33_001953 [Morchella sextelata]|uniref:uncharacterized protein n=1 Tax=Morchella sextelata TaxID=1174677 RepID=UPI001D05B92C|nr:uncharacterized protein H6S33_001953 [Morchella sextelata]KAH0607901.1 hypothetical protein H6S33_001953 [Morchella sextelata]
MQAPPTAPARQYTYLFPPHHRDAADLPSTSTSSSTPRTASEAVPAEGAAEEEPERTISDHALYLLLMVERPLYEDVSSSDGSSCSDGSSSSSSSGSGGEESGADKAAERQGPKHAAAATKPSLKRALRPDEAPEKRGGKRKKVSWAKVVNVRHYPEDSYPDGRRFERRHRSRGGGEEGADGGEGAEGG